MAMVLRDVAGISVLLVGNSEFLLAALHRGSVFKLPYLELLSGWGVPRCSVHSTHLKLTLTLVFTISFNLIQYGIKRLIRLGITRQ